MNLDKFILAIVTINPKKVAGGTAIFTCDSVEEMDDFAKNLEAIIDGIAHKLSEEVYIIVRH
ncbi:capping complex subunit for YIEGIA [Bacillus sp. DJP31]|uniref:capping complex subunit for YIEGIA n=1 Tax=Bacillus sp. DJP31 TaxID=3409789 RepID=UPI003BB7A4BF